MSTRSEPGQPASVGWVPLSVPDVGAAELEHVAEALRSGWVSSAGPHVERFERDFAERVGTAHAVAVASGTAALHVTLQLAGVGGEDEVLVPSLTFIAPANAVRYLGARPVFVDAEPDHWQMDMDRVRDFLENGCERTGDGLRNRRNGRRVAALLPVHVLGHPVDMDACMEVASAWGLPVVEDATESLGSTWQGRSTGTFGAAGCFSFNGNKIITTGGGGMIVTDDAELAERARYLTTQAKDDPVEYVHRSVGYNYRLTNLQAALGVGQLARLDAFMARKQEVAARYTEALRDLPGISFQAQDPRAGSNHWLFTVRVDPEARGVNSRGLLAALSGERIQARPLWQPLHRSPAHEGSESLGGAVAEALNQECLSLPCSAGLTDADLERVIGAVRAAYVSMSEVP